MGSQCLHYDFPFWICQEAGRIVRLGNMLRRPINHFRSYLLDRIVLRPTRDAVDHGRQHRMVLTSKYGPLEAFGSQPAPDSKEASPAVTDLLILKLPGTSGRAERATTFPCELVGELNVHSWTWNPPGYGNSAGRASLQRISDASLDFFQQICERYAIDGNSTARPKVWLSGNSLGCVVAMHLAAALGNVIDGLVLRNPPALDLVIKHAAKSYPFGKWIHPVVDQLPPSMNAIYTASKVTTPTVFLQCERDKLVPPELQAQVRTAFAGPKYLVKLPGLGHDSAIDEKQMKSVAKAIDWLRKESGLSENGEY